MKNTLTLRFPIAEITPGGSVLKCVNLMQRPRARSAAPSLTLAEGFSRIHCDNLRPLSTFTSPEGEEWMLFCSTAPDASSHYSYLVGPAPGRLATIATAAAIPYCAIPTSYGWLVMTSAGHLTITRSHSASTGWAAEWQGMEPPRLTFRAISRGTVSHTVQPLDLPDTDFTRSEPTLSDSSLRNLSQSLLSAYSAITATANENGAWLQPLIARCHLLSADGSRIYTSEPQLIAPAGWQCCEQFTVECTRSDDSTLSLRSFTIEAAIHAVELTVDSLGAYASFTQSIEIALTPQIHPVDFSRTAPYRIIRPATTSPAITVALPGVTASMADNSQARARLIGSLLARLDSLEQTARVAGHATGITYGLSNESNSSPSADTAMIAAAASRAITHASQVSTLPTLRAVSPPHSFTAQRVAISGNTVLWADITPIPSPAPIPSGEWQADNIPEWTGTVRVTFSDGTSQLTNIGYPLPMPLSLPPLITYPDPKAVKWEIWVKNVDDGTLSTATIPLRPAEDSSRAFHLRTLLEPIPLQASTATAYPVADATAVVMGTRIPGLLVAAPLSDPLTPGSVMNLTPAPVVAVHPAVRSNSGWDTTRARFYAFAPTGLYTVVAASNRASLYASGIDPRGFTSPHLVCYTDAGVMGATASGQILRAVASHAEVVAECQQPRALGWHSDTNRLMVLDRDGTLHAFSLSDFSRHTLPTPSSSMIYPYGSSMLAANPSGLLIPSPRPDVPTPIEWQAEYTLVRAAHAGTLYIDMTASSFSGSVTVTSRSSHDPAHDRELLRLDIDGAVAAPIAARLISILHHVVSIAVTGVASPDFRLDSANILIFPLNSRHD